MPLRRHRDDEGLRDSPPGRQGGTRDGPASASSTVLRLQEQSGNRSVVELLAGGGPAALRAQVQRDEDDEIVPEEVSGGGDNEHATGEAVSGGDNQVATGQVAGTNQEVAPLSGPPSAPRATSKTMSIPDLDLLTPINSFQRTGPRETGGRSPLDVVISLAAEALDSRVSDAAAQGGTFATVVISGGAQTITMHGVSISALSTGGSSASITLTPSGSS